MSCLACVAGGSGTVHVVLNDEIGLLPEYGLFEVSRDRGVA
jgi:hypothetical protein